MGRGLRSQEARRASEFAAVFHATHRRVRAHARRRAGARRVDDVVAETYVAAWRRFDELPKDHAGAVRWLLRTADLVVMNLVRSERRQAALGARLQHELVAARQGAVPDGLEASDILAAFATLSDRDKEILLLAGWYGLSPAEVAARLGCSSGAAATRLTRARGRLLAASEGR